MRGRLLRAPTDWRILCSPIPSIPAVRQLPSGKSWLAKRSSPGSTLERKVEKFDSNGCAHGAREATRRRRCIAIVEKFAAMVACTERARREGEGDALQLCEEAQRGGDVRARQRAGSGSTVEETCARDSAQAAEVRSHCAWCGGEGDCARKRAGSSVEEESICVEERAFRARWGARRTHVEVDA